MFDYQTIFIYLSLFAIMFLLACHARRNESWIPIIIAVLIYSAIFGMRYKVGSDYMSYFTDYEYASILSNNIMQTHYEPGFRFIMMTLIGLKAHFSWFFGVVAFLQLYLVFRSVKDEPEVYPYLVFTFMISCVWLTYANGLRQQLAFCLFTLAIFFVEKNNWLLYYITIAISISMHNSAGVLVVMYPLLRFKTDWYENVDVRIQLLILFVAVILGNIGVVQKYFGLLETYASYLGYERYFLDKYDGFIYQTVGQKGVGYYVMLLINILLVVNSTKFKEFFDRKYVYYIYNLYYIGVILTYAVMGNPLIWRLNYYFYGFSFIVGAHALLYAKENDKKTYWSLLGLYVLIFVGTMYKMEGNTAFFRFYWQVNERVLLNPDIL